MYVMNNEVSFSILQKIFTKIVDFNASMQPGQLYEH